MPFGASAIAALASIRPDAGSIRLKGRRNKDGKAKPRFPRTTETRVSQIWKRIPLFLHGRRARTKTAWHKVWTYVHYARLRLWINNETTDVAARSAADRRIYIRSSRKSDTCPFARKLRVTRMIPRCTFPRAIRMLLRSTSARGRTMNHVW